MTSTILQFPGQAKMGAKQARDQCHGKNTLDVHKAAHREEAPFGYPGPTNRKVVKFLSSSFC